MAKGRSRRLAIGKVLIASSRFHFVQFGQGDEHVKFAASLVDPAPVHSATCGYGQSGRVICTLPPVTFDAMI
jgi:hypothetical protein